MHQILTRLGYRPTLANQMIVSATSCKHGSPFAVVDTLKHDATFIKFVIKSPKRIEVNFALDTVALNIFNESFDVREDRCEGL